MEFKTTFAFLVFVVVEAQSTCLFFCCLEMSLMDINFIITIIIIVPHIIRDTQIKIWQQKNCCDKLAGKTVFWTISIGNLDNYLAINEGTVSNAQSEAVIQPF